MPIAGTTPCGAKTRKGTPCMSAAMPNGRCRMHGGSTPKGARAHNFKTGMRSRDLPTRLAATFIHGTPDPVRLTLDREIAAIDMLIIERCRALPLGENRRTWMALRDARDMLLAGRATEDYGKQTEALNRIMDLIPVGVSEWNAVDGLRDLLDDRRKLVAGETARIKLAQDSVTVDEARTLVAAMFAGLQLYITDVDERERVWAHVAAAIGAGKTAAPIAEAVPGLEIDDG